MRLVCLRSSKESGLTDGSDGKASEYKVKTGLNRGLTWPDLILKERRVKDDSMFLVEQVKELTCY